MAVVTFRRFIRPVMAAGLGLFIGAGLVGAGPTAGPAWPDIRRRIAENYPRVAGISTEELARRLEDAGRTKPVLIDVRAREEFAVSRLPGAVWAETEAQQRAVLDRQPADRPVVFYCSVGWRSARAADRWRRAGRARVFNLDGSIFQWANENRPLFRDGQAVTVVHPYDRAWGALLDRRRWSHDPTP